MPPRTSNFLGVLRCISHHSAKAEDGIKDDPLCAGVSIRAHPQHFIASRPRYWIISFSEIVPFPIRTIYITWGRDQTKNTHDSAQIPASLGLFVRSTRIWLMFPPLCRHKYNFPKILSLLVYTRYLVERSSSVTFQWQMLRGDIQTWNFHRMLHVRPMTSWEHRWFNEDRDEIRF